jgi:hypothetical protein
MHCHSRTEWWSNGHETMPPTQYIYTPCSLLLEWGHDRSDGGLEMDSTASITASIHYIVERIG